MIGHNNTPPDYDGSPKDIFLAFVVHVLMHKYEKLIGHTIAYFMDDEGNCDISIPDLIKYSGIEDARTLNKYIKSIEHKKALEAERRRGKRNQYKMVAEYIQIALQDARVDVAKTTLSTEKAPTSGVCASHEAPTSGVCASHEVPAPHVGTSHEVAASDVSTSDACASRKVTTSDATTRHESHARANIDNNIKKNKKTNTSYLQKKQKKFDLVSEDDQPITYDPANFKTKHQLPDIWRVEPPLRAWAKNGKIGATDKQIDEQSEKFKLHHTAKGSTMKNWNSAFQTWMHNAKDYGHLKPKQQFRNDRFYREDGKMRA